MRLLVISVVLLGVVSAANCPWKWCKRESAAAAAAAEEIAGPPEHPPTAPEDPEPPRAMAKRQPKEQGILQDFADDCNNGWALSCIPGGIIALFGGDPTGKRSIERASGEAPDEECSIFNIPACITALFKSRPQPTYGAPDPYKRSIEGASGRPEKRSVEEPDPNMAVGRFSGCEKGFCRPGGKREAKIDPRPTRGIGLCHPLDLECQYLNERVFGRPGGKREVKRSAEEPDPNMAVGRFSGCEKGFCRPGGKREAKIDSRPTRGDKRCAPRDYKCLNAKYGGLPGMIIDKRSIEGASDRPDKREAALPPGFTPYIPCLPGYHWTPSGCFPDRR